MRGRASTCHAGNRLMAMFLNSPTALCESFTTFGGSEVEQGSCARLSAAMKLWPRKPGRVQDEEDDEDEDDYASLMPNLASLAVQDVEECSDTGGTEIVNSPASAVQVVDDSPDTAGTEIVLPAASLTVQVKALRPAGGPLFSATYTRRRKLMRGGETGIAARRTLYPDSVGESRKNTLQRGEHPFLHFVEPGEKNVLQEVQNFFDNRRGSSHNRERKVKVRSRRSLTRVKRKSTERSNFQICFDADENENEVAGWDEEMLMEDDDRPSEQFCFHRSSPGQADNSSFPVTSPMANTCDLQPGRKSSANQPVQDGSPIPKAVVESGNNTLPPGGNSFLQFIEPGQTNMLEVVQSLSDNGQGSIPLTERKKVRSRRSLTRAKRHSTERSNFQICLDAVENENEVAGRDEEMLMEEDDRPSEELCFHRSSPGQGEKSSFPNTSSMVITSDGQIGRILVANQPASPILKADSCGGPECLFEELEGLGSGEDMDFVDDTPVEDSTCRKGTSLKLMDRTYSPIDLSPAKEVPSVDELQVQIGDSNDAPTTLGLAGEMPQVEGLQIHIDGIKDAPITLSPAEDMPGLEGLRVHIREDISVSTSTAKDVPVVEELQADQGAENEHGVNLGLHAEPSISARHMEAQVDTAVPDDTRIPPSPADELAEQQDVRDRTTTCNDTNIDEQAQPGNDSQPGRSKSKATRLMEVSMRKRMEPATSDYGVNIRPNAEPGLTPPHVEAQVDMVAAERHRLETTGRSPPHADDLAELHDVPDSHIDEQKEPSNDSQPGRSKTKRKKMEVGRRKSLLGAGTKWEDGRRRSTRIKVPPVEWWNNEKLLYGRVSETLCTLVGIKKLLPTTPPVGRRQKEKPQKFEITSFVSPKWKGLVDFVAL